MAQKLIDNDQLENLDASKVTSGQFADARISQSSVTQHQGAIDHDALTNFVANEHIDHSGVSITGGGIITGGGDITSSRVLTLNHSDVDHDQTTNFVANEHIDHSGVTITGTNSVTGGGDITASRTLDLVNDLASPGNYQVYGTNGTGTKGWFNAGGFDRGQSWSDVSGSRNFGTVYTNTSGREIMVSVSFVGSPGGSPLGSPVGSPAGTPPGDISVDVGGVTISLGDVNADYINTFIVPNGVTYAVNYTGVANGTPIASPSFYSAIWAELS